MSLIVLRDSDLAEAHVVGSVSTLAVLSWPRFSEYPESCRVSGDMSKASEKSSGEPRIFSGDDLSKSSETSNSSSGFSFIKSSVMILCSLFIAPVIQ